MDRLSSMEAFVTAAECGSYVKAAERRRWSQSTLPRSSIDSARDC
jgi:DNA-binding transcriptional LysR family regulator